MHSKGEAERMENTIKSKIAKFKEQRNYKKKLYAWFTLFALIIGAGTIWILVQPANTMSGEIICGIKEHTHTDECYKRQLVCEKEEDENHTHDETCWNTELACMQMEHIHNETCYDVQTPENIAPDPVEQEQSQPNSKPVEENEQMKISATQEQVLQQLRKEIPADYTEIRTATFSEEGIVYLFSQPNVLSKEIKLKVKLLENTSEIFAKAEQRVKAEGIEYDNIGALDISLINEKGEEVEPTSPVYVSIDFGKLLTDEVDPETIQVQHHKEILPIKEEFLENGMEDSSKEAKVVLESVLEDENSILLQNANTQSYIATFPTDSFSIYTITSSGWPNLKIKIQCVDEFGHELYGDDKPKDIVFDGKYTPGASFNKLFMSNDHDKISGYKYDGKAYLMRNGEYDRQIYGIRREGNQWYYHTQDNNVNSKALFSPQPNFEKKGEQDPPDFIRVVYRKVTDIHVKYMDEAGVFGENEIPLTKEDSPNGKNPDVIEYVGTELELGNTDVMPKSSTYFYRGKAYVGDPEYENQVVKVIRKDRKPYGVSLEGKEMLISEQSPLKLIYRKINTTAPEQVTMVPLREKGLKINLFNYNTRKADTSINNGHRLQFKPQGNSNEPYNDWTGKDGGVYQGIVGNTLVNGYPTIQGESLDYLFDPDRCRQQLETGEVKNVYTNLDRLFWQDKDGYYHYNAMTNFATVVPENATAAERDSDGKDFIVYKQPVLPTVNGTGDNAKFLPFDTYTNANKPKPEHVQADKEYHFGMTMEAEFTMPPGGQVPDADGGHTGFRDMIFEFNGDDDVWVFIDNQLVLDLGGIHDRYGGKINFRTGEVITNAPPTPHSGRYQKNLYNIDPTGMSDDELKTAREKAGFGKFSHHMFKFFYLERGEGASNCEIRFNLVPVQHGLIVGKRLPEETMKDVATDHMWYQFQAGTEFKGERKPLANATFRRIKWKPGVHPITGGQDVGIGQSDEQGRFWLRAGERADFAGAIDLKKTGITDKEKIKIYVREILPDGSPAPIAWSGKEETPGTYIEVRDEDGKVINKVVPSLYDYNGAEMKVNLHTDSTKEIVTERQIPDTGEKAYEVSVDTGMKNEFNWIDFENNIGSLAGLNIKKIAKKSDKTPIKGVPFAIKVELWDTKDKIWTPLPEGTDYWILTEKEFNLGDKLPEKDKLQIKKTDNGLISIEHDQSIHMHILPGTKYRVSEVLNTEDKVAYTTTYEGHSTVAGDEFINTQNQEIENKTGIQANSQHYITINNTGDPVIMPKGSFVLMKKTNGIVPPDTKFQFQMQIQGYSNSENKLSCTATYYGTPTGARVQGREETIEFKPGANGQYEGNLSLYSGEIVVIENLPEGKQLQVQEIFAETQSGDYTVSFQEDGKDVVQGNKIVTSAIASNHVVKVTCLNESNLKEDSNLSISKEVKRTDRPDGSPLPEEKERSFPFRVTIQKPGTISLEEVSCKKMLANGEVNYSKLAFELNGEDYVANVELKHGEKIIIHELPAGVQVLVQEMEHDGYAVSMNGNSGDQITVDLGYNTGAPYEVKCVNMTGVKLPETGGHGVIPYFVIGAVMMLSALGLFFWSSRRKIG